MGDSFMGAQYDAGSTGSGVGLLPERASAPAGPDRSVTIGSTSYPVILPKLRDPRLHVAAVVVTLHVLGQVGLHFRVSVPQILSAILTTAVLGVVISFRRTKSFVWPASAMLTGSGIALILRVPGTPDNHWTFHAWWMFAGVAAFSLLTKEVIKYRGTHLFNPSNIGLVLTFLVLGSTRVEPLDFWWAPLNKWMITAYLVILVGGSLITARLRLLMIAGAFWVTFAAALGLLASTGHCITARWAFTPVCGFDYWRVIVTSPELLIFMYFMITDPKTVPTGRVGKVVFGFLVAVVCVLLMAPQTTEFGSKVALLSGLALMCAVRPIFDRLVPAPGSADDRLGRYALSIVGGGESGVRFAGRVARVAVIAAAFAAVGVGVVAAGTSARGVIASDAESVLGRVPHEVNPATLPSLTVEQGVLDWNHEISGAGAQQIVLTLAENLDLESQAMLRHDESILKAVDHGDRLDAMTARLRTGLATGAIVVQRYRIDAINVTLLVPFGRQDGLSLGLESRGTMTKETYDTAGHLQSRASSPFSTMFVMRRATGARWLNVSELPVPAGH
jgi:Na+-translocating ferredoxin:NAD+ oxidoreductase RnfD subunit